MLLLRWYANFASGCMAVIISLTWGSAVLIGIRNPDVIFPVFPVWISSDLNSRVIFFVDRTTFSFTFVRVVRWTNDSKSRNSSKDFRRFGFWYANRVSGRSPLAVYAFVIGIPTPLAIGLFGLYPLLRFRRIRQIKRWRQNGMCTSCGYDMRGSPDQCPECGTFPCNVFRPQKLREFST